MTNFTDIIEWIINICTGGNGFIGTDDTIG